MPADDAEYVGLAGPEAEALASARGWRTRLLPPGAMMTMDYRPDRLNLYLDDAGTVTRAHPG